MSDAWMAVGFFFFVMTAVVAAGYFVLDRRQRTVSGTPGELPAAFPRGGSLFHRTFESIGAMVPAAKQAGNPVRRELIAAGYYEASALPMFYGFRCAVGLGFGALLTIASGWLYGEKASALLPAIAGAGIGYFLPSRLLRGAIRARRRRLRRALPTALDLCVLSLEAGMPIDQAILDTSRGLRRSYSDLANEFQLVFTETRTTNNRYEALHNFGIRTNEPEIRKIATLLNDADRFGGSIVPALRNHARYLRIRMRQQAQEAARKVSVKLIFPIFFLIFPSVMLVTLGPAFIMVMGQLRAMLK